MDAITKFFADFDLSKLLPQLDTVLGKVELLLRIAVMAGPVILLILGLCYLFLPPKEANHSFGYRFFWGMSSVDAWRFMQRIAGIVWSVAGLILTIIMLVLCARFRGMQTMDMISSSVRCVLWELGVLAATILGIDITTLVFFDRRGERRRKKASLADAAQVQDAPAESDGQDDFNMPDLEQ